MSTPRDIPFLICNLIPHSGACAQGVLDQGKDSMIFSLDFQGLRPPTCPLMCDSGQGWGPQVLLSGHASGPLAAE